MPTSDNEQLIAVRVAEASAVLLELGLSPAKHGERSALTLLALLGLQPCTPWSEAQNPPLGIFQIIEFISAYYGKHYAPNTRESIRRLSVQAFREEGLLEENPDAPERPKTSGKFVYQIRQPILELLRSYQSAKWKPKLRAYLDRERLTLDKLKHRFERPGHKVRLGGLRLKNFRSLVDTQLIELRPIVVLVGQNGSGKSSFLRFFPLLRQTIAARADTPVQWYGQDVDFGEFGAVVNQTGPDRDGKISIELQVDLLPEQESQVTERVLAHVTLVEEEQRTVVRACQLQCNGQLAHLEFGKDGSIVSFLVNAVDILDHEYAARREPGQLIPRLLDPSERMPDDPWFARAVPILLQSLNDCLATFAPSIHYAAPVREAPQRLYRVRESEAGQIDPHGANLAMFLHDLTETEQGEFSNWVFENFGFRVQVQSEGRWNLAIKITENQREFNLIDMGYGFSQVLPVIAQCWASRTGGSASRQQTAPTFLALEQPELHLHPHHQAKLADVFAAVIHSGQTDAAPLRLLMETHSESLVNRFGELIEQGKLRREDVLVLLFEKDPETGDTTVQTSEYDEHGFLMNWPVGFFAP